MANVAEAKTDRFSRLPKWAREEMTHLRRRVDELSGDLHELSVPQKDTNVALQYVGPDMEDWGLPKDSKIAFYVGDTRTPFPQHIAVSLKKNYRNEVSLYVAASDGSLVITPSATNSIRLRVER